MNLFFRRTVLLFSKHPEGDHLWFCNFSLEEHLYEIWWDRFSYNLDKDGDYQYIIVLNMESWAILPFLLLMNVSSFYMLDFNKFDIKDGSHFNKP